MDRPCILIIDDDPVVRFNLVSYLEDSGFRVAEADSGAAGLDQVHEAPPHLIVCDLRMPGVDGMEVLDILRADFPHLPVVVISGTGVLGDAVEALRRGAWDFIAKPIADMAVLEHAIDGALEKARLVTENNRYQEELRHANRQLEENLEKFREDADAGRQIQLQLMPPQERLMGPYRFNRYLLPSLYLSGDFVDYFVIDHQHVGFYLADVSGHGVSSAFVTILLRSVVHRYLRLRESEWLQTVLHPGEMLETLNADLLAQQFDKYLTMFYAVVDLERNRLTYSTGGHFPPPVLFDGIEARFLPGRGMPVGLVPDATYECQELDLPSTHLLALFSDGVLDALPEPTLAAKRQRLLEAVNRRGLTASGILEHLGLTGDTGYPDDITLLIAEREI